MKCTRAGHDDHDLVHPRHFTVRFYINILLECASGYWHTATVMGLTTSQYEQLGTSDFAWHCVKCTRAGHDDGDLVHPRHFTVRFYFIMLLECASGYWHTAIVNRLVHWG